MGQYTLTVSCEDRRWCLLLTFDTTKLCNESIKHMLYWQMSCIYGDNDDMEAFCKECNAQIDSSGTKYIHRVLLNLEGNRDQCWSFSYSPH